MRRTTKGTALTVGLAAGALVLTACGGGGDGDEAGTDGPVDLTMTVWTSDENIIAKYEALADGFREENPELGELTVQTIPFEDYLAQLTIQLNGGDAPDLGWVVESATPAFVSSGALADLGALRDDPDYDFDDIVPGLLSALEGEDGELYGYPFASTTHPIIYNVTAFEQAGVQTPLELFEAGEWTWENLRRVAKEVVDAGATTYGFDIPQFGFTSYALFTPVLKAFGAEAWPDGTTCGYDTPESIEAFEFLNAMIYEDGSYPGPGNTSSFPTGDTAMMLNPPSILATMADSEFEFDIVPQPSGTEGFDPFLGQASMVAFAGGDAPELATRLLAHLTSNEGSNEFLEWHVPPRKSLQTPENITKLSPLLTPEAGNRSLLQTLDVAYQLEYPVAYPELETAVRPVLDAVWQPDGDIPAAAAAACAAAEPILESQ